MKKTKPPEVTKTDNHFGQDLALLLDALKMKPADLGRRMGWSNSYQYQILHGKTMSDKGKRKIIEALGLHGATLPLFDKLYKKEDIEIILLISEALQQDKSRAPLKKSIKEYIKS